MGENGKEFKYRLLVTDNHGDIKYSIRNRVAKELICRTHGHGQWCGDCLREWGCWVEGGQGGKSGTTVIANQ